MEWKDKLKALMAAGLSQADIAAKIGLTPGAVSQVLNDETGKRGFGPKSGKRLDALLKRVERRIAKAADQEPDAEGQP